MRSRLCSNGGSEFERELILWCVAMPGVAMFVFQPRQFPGEIVHHLRIAAFEVMAAGRPVRHTRSGRRGACDEALARVPLGAALQPRRTWPGRATLPRSALLAQLVEHFHGNERVPGSSRAASSLRVAEDPGRAGDSATIDMRASVHEVPWVATTAG